MLLGGDPIGGFPFGGYGEEAGAVGDEFRDACRARLQAHISTAGISWSLLDLLNTGTNPDVSSSFIDIEFPGGNEDQYTFGAPGNNFFDERGQLTIRVTTRLGAGLTERNLAEIYAGRLRNLFRNDRFAAGNTTVRITAAEPMGGGHDEAGLWSESLALRYRRYVIG
jgi:hypothetical protein